MLESKNKFESKTTISPVGAGILVILAVLLAALTFSGCNENEPESKSADRIVIPVHGISESQQSDWTVTLVHRIDGTKIIDMRLIKHEENRLVLLGVRELGDNLVMKHPRVVLNIREKSSSADENVYAGFYEEEGQGTADAVLRKLNSLCYRGTAAGAYAYAHVKGAKCGP